MRLDPASVEGDVGLKRISQIIRTFVDLNIYHIQFNVVSSEVLRCAQEKPEMRWLSKEHGVACHLFPEER